MSHGKRSASLATHIRTLENIISITSVLNADGIPIVICTKYKIIYLFIVIIKMRFDIAILAYHCYTDSVRVSSFGYLWKKQQKHRQKSSDKKNITL